MESDAIEVQVLRLLDNFPSQASKVTNATIDTYCSALEGLDPEAVRKAVHEFCTGMLDRDHAFRPNPPEVAARARQWHNAMHPRFKPLELSASDISPEERARVKARFEELIAHRVEDDLERQLQASEVKRKRMARTNDAALARDPRPLAERLSAGRIRLDPVEVSAELG